jgi:tetratricopeptide (TPR) repeat protein
LLSKPYKDSNVTDAVKGFQIILEHDPKSALAQAGLGSGYFDQYNSTHDPKLLDLAKAATSQAISMDSKLAAPYVTQARMSAAAGQTAVALEQAQKAIKLDPHSADAQGALAQVYQAQGRTDDAIAAVQKAIDLAPEDSASIWVVRLGNYYFAKGDIKNAAAQWRKGIEMDPENVNAMANLGLANMQLGKLDDAHEELQSAVAMQPSAANYTGLGNVLMLKGNYSDAIQMNQKALSLNPKDYRAWGNLASAYQWSGKDREKATQSYLKAIEIAEADRQKTPNNADILVELADYYASSGNANRSLPLVRKALALAPEDPHIVYRAGETYEILGQRDKAVPLITQALTQGYDANEFQRSPDLASLRNDKAFQAALEKAKANPQKSVDRNAKVN